MLKWLISTQEVGIYAVASNISEVWYFLPTAIVSSIFPKLIELHQSNTELFQQRISQLINLLFCLALVISISTSFIAKPLIKLLYGQAYYPSGIILMIHMWASLFIFMRAAFSKWILIENVPVFSLITQGLGAVSNIVLNLFLIPKYSGVGAAIATVISYAMASYLSLFFYKKSRPIFWMMSRSFLSPMIYSYKLITSSK